MIEDCNILKELLNYDPVSGVFIWKKSRGRCAAGAIAGSLFSNGYVRIHFLNRDQLAHRLAWLYVYGEWPEDEIDHIDGDKKNNSISNLRKCSSGENKQNRKSSGRSSKYLGVSWATRDKVWISQITVNGVTKKLGAFKVEYEAAEAYRKAKRELHNFNPEVNR